jgi:hypothetical protein
MVAPGLKSSLSMASFLPALFDFVSAFIYIPFTLIPLNSMPIQVQLKTCRANAASWGTIATEPGKMTGISAFNRLSGEFTAGERL